MVNVLPSGSGEQYAQQFQTPMEQLYPLVARPPRSARTNSTS